VASAVMVVVVVVVVVVPVPAVVCDIFTAVSKKKKKKSDSRIYHDHMDECDMPNHVLHCILLLYYEFTLHKYGIRNQG
jgi:hypothetical protein